LRYLAVFVGMIAATACGSDRASMGMSPSPTPTPIGPVVLIPLGAETLGDMAYVPDELVVAVGQTVTWTNLDAGVAHTTTSNEAGWDSGSLSPGGQFSRTFQVAGAFRYHCSIHPGMTGRVVVQ